MYWCFYFLIRNAPDILNDGFGKAIQLQSVIGYSVVYIMQIWQPRGHDVLFSCNSVSYTSLMRTSEEVINSTVQI